VALGYCREAFRQLDGFVTVAHPHVDAVALVVGEQARVGHNVNGHATILSTMQSWLHLATKQVSNHLRVQA
jgi:hypothetical protein